MGVVHIQQCVSSLLSFITAPYSGHRILQGHDKTFPVIEDISPVIEMEPFLGLSKAAITSPKKTYLISYSSYYIQLKILQTN